MSLHPQVADVLKLIASAARPGYHEMAAHEARALHARNAPLLNLAADSLPHVRDIVIAGGGGSRAARVYAASEPHNLPVVLWLHGGGHTLGGIDGYDPICRRLAHESGALIVSLDYRLASVASIRWFQAQYLNHDGEREDWRFAPLLAADHSALAPAMVMVASHDPLRDEGIAYAQRLEGAGTPVELVRHDGMIHAFWSLAGAVDEAALSMRRAGAFLRRALAVPAVAQ